MEEKQNDELIKMRTKSPAKTKQHRKSTMWIDSDTKGSDFSRLISRTLSCIDMTHMVNNIKKGSKYVVQVPMEYQKALNEGKLFINQNLKTGVKWPSLYEKLPSGKRKFVCNLPIDEENFVQGNPFSDIVQEYNNIYLQKMIRKLDEKMQETLDIVQEIKLGQWADRIADLKAGRDLLMRAMGLKDDNEKKLDIVNARQLMTSAQRKILEGFKILVLRYKPISDVKWIREACEALHEGYFDRKQDEFDDIQECYSLYIDATMMVAYSYLVTGNREIAENVFKEAEDNIRELGLNYDAVKTLGYIHNGINVVDYIEKNEMIRSKKRLCLKQNKYDTIGIIVDSDVLMEAINNE